MAEVSSLHRLNHHPPPLISNNVGPRQNEEPGHPEEELYNQPNPFGFDFDSFSAPINSTRFQFLEDYSTSFDFGFDLNDIVGCEYEEPNCFFYEGEDDDEQMNFVTDLFESGKTHVAEDPLTATDSDRTDDFPLELGFGLGLGGLRLTGMDSESDSEEFEVNSGVNGNNNEVDDDDEINYDSVAVDNTISYHIGEIEWEEVLHGSHHDERETLNSVIGRIEEMSISSNITQSEGEEDMGFGDDEGEEDVGFGDDEGEEEEQRIEWQVLLAVNNLERHFEFENSEENNFSESEMSMEYNTLFEQLVENDSAVNGSPPTAKSVVENLPSVVLRKEEMGDNSGTVLCAVCKDEVPFGEKVTKMPCSHLYHGDCILPWLRIRNTCPVCRYELPTDDPDYERRRNVRGGSGIASGSVDDSVRYSFELLP